MKAYCHYMRLLAWVIVTSVLCMCALVGQFQFIH